MTQERSVLYIKETKMNRSTFILLLIFTLIMTACSGNFSNSATSTADTQSGPAAGELSALMQTALGIIKLDGTENAITASQAKELLPLWETLQVLESSDTAAAGEKDALITQIQETMTQEQAQAINALNLTRQDMFSIMQSQGTAFEGSQSGMTQRNGTSANGGFGPGGGGFIGGAPPDGDLPGGGNPNFQGQRPDAQSGNSTDTANRPAALDPNRLPTPLIQAVIDYLKTIAGS